MGHQGTRFIIWGSNQLGTYILAQLFQVNACGGFRSHAAKGDRLHSGDKGGHGIAMWQANQTYTTIFLGHGRAAHHPNYRPVCIIWLTGAQFKGDGVKMVGQSLA
ncbi:MAG: hypothetical protein HC804_02875 [Anaerolineae bacterium]|nr:hypothetical protein [Anaerolineae bacterium]